MTSVRVDYWKRLLQKFAPFVLLAAIGLLALDWLVNKPVMKDPKADLIPELPAIQASANSGDDASVRDLLASLTKPKAMQVEPPRTEELGMNAEEQLNQRGFLKELYVGDKVYRLVAIIKSKGRYQAVLSVRLVSETSGTSHDRISVEVSDEIDDYQVVELEAKKIMLIQQDRKVWLELFAPAQTLAASNSPEINKE